MAQFISFRVAGFGFPSTQKSHSSSPLIGNAPQLIDTACTPGVAAMVASPARNAARMAAGLVFNEEGEREKLKNITFCGLNPGFTFQSWTRLRNVRPAPTSNTSA